MTTGMIYIVDDNAETAQSLAFFLESLGWRTRVWNDPEAFLNDYEALAADGCFIFDIRMPRIDGLELLERQQATDHLLNRSWRRQHGSQSFQKRCI